MTILSNCWLRIGNSDTFDMFSIKVVGLCCVKFTDLVNVTLTSLADLRIEYEFDDSILSLHATPPFKWDFLVYICRIYFLFFFCIQISTYSNKQTIIEQWYFPCIFSQNDIHFKNNIRFFVDVLQNP